MKKYFKIRILFAAMLLFLFLPTFHMDAKADVVGTNGAWSFSEETGVLLIYKNIGDFRIQSSSSDYTFATPWEIAGIDRQIKTVVIKEGVTKVGNLAFAWLSNINEVIFPQTLEIIGAEAFMECSLTTIEIPASVKEIGCRAFDGCRASTIILHGSVPAIGTISYFYGYDTGAREIFKGLYANVYYYSDDWPTEKYGASSLTWHKMTCSSHQVWIDEAVLPGCTTNGRTEGSHCTICGEIITAQETIPSLGHTVVTDEGIAPTCTQPGLTEGSHCEVCSTVLSAQRAIAPLGHTIEIDAAIAPTCTGTGFTEGSHCSVCDEVLTEQEEVPALGHSWVMDEEEEATCTENGLTAGVHCDRCGEILVPQEEIPAEGHKPVTDDILLPNCTEEGLTEGSHCETCGEIIKVQEPIAALGHKVSSIPEVPPTCTDAGLTEGQRCSRCKEILVPQENIPAIGHDWDEGVITQSASCISEGMIEFICRNDPSHSKKETLAINPDNHSLTKVDTVYPTATENGHKEYWQCNNCGKIFSDDKAFKEIETPIIIPIFGDPDFILPSDLTEIKEEAFIGIHAVIVSVPETCTKIGAYAFSNSSVAQIKIPEKCEICKDVFAGCKYVYIYGVKGSKAESYCECYDNCFFVELA